MAAFVSVSPPRRTVSTMPSSRTGRPTILFSLGIIGIGFLAVPVMTGGAAYDLCHTVGWKYAPINGPRKPGELPRDIYQTPRPSHQGRSRRRSLFQNLIFAPS